MKLLFLVVISLFELGSVIYRAAQSSTALIIGRAIAGIGEGGILSGGLVITTCSRMCSRLPSHCSAHTRDSGWWKFESSPFQTINCVQPALLRLCYVRTSVSGRTFNWGHFHRSCIVAMVFLHQVRLPIAITAIYIIYIIHQVFLLAQFLFWWLPSSSKFLANPKIRINLFEIVF